MPARREGEFQNRSRVVETLVRYRTVGSTSPDQTRTPTQQTGMMARCWIDGWGRLGLAEGVEAVYVTDQTDDRVSPLRGTCRLTRRCTCLRDLWPRSEILQSAGQNRCRGRIVVDADQGKRLVMVTPL